MMNDRSRKMLISHARNVQLYNKLGVAARAQFMDSLRKSIELQGVGEEIVEEMMEILERYLQVDPYGGRKMKNDEKIVYHEPML